MLKAIANARNVAWTFRLKQLSDNQIDLDDPVEPRRNEAIEFHNEPNCAPSTNTHWEPVNSSGCFEVILTKEMIDKFKGKKKETADASDEITNVDFSLKRPVIAAALQKIALSLDQWEDKHELDKETFECWETWELIRSRIEAWNNPKSDPDM